MVDSIYNKLSEERKRMQEEGTLPEWYSTGAWQMFKKKYLFGAETWLDQIKRICKTAAKHTPNPDYWEPKFFELFWKNWLSPSTPILANTGTTRGLPVACSGCYTGDSVPSFYETAKEIAVLSQKGFGTSAYLGDIRPRGSAYGQDGKADGIMPVVNLLTSTCRHISQGSSRRGSGAWYYPIDGGDFHELLAFLEANPDDLNIGWNISDAFIERLKSGDEEAISRFQEALKVKMTVGKGYFFFVDKVNRARPDMYKNNQLDVKSSQLCSEVFLHSSSEYTYTCILSSMNVYRYDEWKDTDAVFTATVFLDCICSEFIEQAKDIPELSKAIAFTEKGRALGLGQMGLFSLFQKKRISPESFEAHRLNIEIAKSIAEQSDKASEWMAKEWGEPEWCKGYGKRNTHVRAIAPTKSTALLMGGWSEGINPEPAMAYSASSAAGDIDRASPVLVELIKEKGLDVDKCIKDILGNSGSVRGLPWLTDEEQSIFKTAFEINQEVLVRYAACRQPYVDQGQSTNLFFGHDAGESEIARVHQMAFLDERVHSLYYVYSSSELSAETTECEACQ